LGVALLNIGSICEAAEQLEQACELDPKNVSVLAHLARVRLLECRIEEARDLAAQVRAAEPTNPLGALLLASAAMLADDRAAAAEALQDAAKTAPGNWLPHYLLGVLLIAEGDGKLATRHLRAAAYIDSRSAAIQHALGGALGLQREWRKAVRSFREALTLAPQRRESVLALTRALLRQSNTDEAIAILSDWVARVPGDRESQELLAQCYRGVGNYRAARRHLHNALQALPVSSEFADDRARILNNLGVCAATLGEYTEATQWYTRSIQVVGNPIAIRNLAQAYRKLGDGEAALKVLAQALADDPADYDTRLLASIVAGELGYANEAVAMLHKLIRDGDAGADAYAALGWILSDETRDYSAALDILSEGRRRFPGDAVIANNLAYVNLMRGDIDAAESILSSVAAEGVHASVYLTATRGLLHLRRREFDRASTLYRAAEDLARQSGRSDLAKTARQKMHLEFARELLRANDVAAALAHVKKGLAVDGRRSYREDLHEIRRQLLQSDTH